MDVEKVIDTVVAKFIGTKHERDVKRITPMVASINELEPEMKKLTDAQIAERAAALRAEVQERLEGVERDDPDYKRKLQEAFEPAIPPAFALTREVGRRTIGMRHFDVQLIGGIVLHEGKIAEMKTGEGKTLVATLPAFLNSLAGQGVHIVTVNDYLARRDAEWMSPIYKMLGLTVGVIVHDLDDVQRRAAYAADITYGTNNEFGFDYLRDNMKYDLADCVQRGHQFGIVDEVDSILIDEARTPLIISGPAEESTDKYYRIDKIIPKLIPDIDYTLDEKLRTATLTEEGVSKCERLLSLGNLYDPDNMELIHHVYQGLRAHTLFEKDVDYVVKDGEVIIVDEFTGRQMPGRRWSDGLHQAVEAKEGVKIERENQTLATITFQNYFRMYKKLSGMTGTAETEAPEFHKIYKLEVVAIPDEQAADPPRSSGRGLPHGEGKIRSGGQRNHSGRWHEERRRPAIFRERAAGAGRQHLDREIGKNRRAPEEGGHSAPGAEREAARARSENHCAGRAQRRGDGLDEHGRPRNRYFAGRQSRADDARAFPEEQARDALRAGRGRDRPRGRRRNARASGCRSRWRRIRHRHRTAKMARVVRARQDRMARALHRWFCSSRKAKFFRCRSISGSRSSTSSPSSARPNTTKWWPWAGCTFSAPNGTRRGASIISCAGARDARAIRDRRDSSFHSKTTCCGFSAARRSRP